MLDDGEEIPIMMAFSSIDEIVDFLDWMREHLPSREAVETWVDKQFTTVRRDLSRLNHPANSSYNTEQMLNDALFWGIVDSLDEEQEEQEEYDDGVSHPD